MKITDAIASLLRELQHRGDVDVKLETPSDKCEKHSGQDRDSCPYCDLCEHGVNRYMDCRACHANDDRGWMIAPVTDQELDALVLSFNDCYGGETVRNTPHRLRNYGADQFVRLMPLIAKEIREARSQK